MFLTITALTPRPSVLATSGLLSVNQATSPGAGSLFGSAATFSGSIQDFTQGLYNSAGAMLGVSNTRLAAATNEASTTAQDKRVQTITAAAAKIDGGDPKAGRALAESLLEKNSSDTAAVHLIAHSYLAEQNYKKAEQFYARASALSPDSELVKSDLANARSLQKSDDEVLADGRNKLKSPNHRIEGLKLLLHLSDRSPDNAEVYLAIANGFGAGRDPIAVIGALQEGLRIADGSKIDKVVSSAKQLVDDYPEFGLAHNLLGRALQKSGRLREAIRSLQAATRVAPDNRAYVTDLANAYVVRAEKKLEAGNVDSARSDLQIVQGLDPSNVGLDEANSRVAAYRAGKFIVAGLYNRALGELRRAEADAPNDERFRDKVAGLYFQVAAHFEKEGADAIALSSYRKAYKLDPDSTVARRKVGELSYKEGLAAVTALNYDSAISLLERAYGTDGFNDTYRQALANAYDLRGQLRVTQDKLDDAISDYEKGFALDPANTSLDANFSAALAQKAAT